MKATQMPAIELTALAKSFRGVRVLDDLSLVVPRGTVFALLGPNGAGKTTTVRILATLLDADGGEARVAGFDVRAQRSEVRKRISLTGQFAAVDALQTGEENLWTIGRLAGLGRRTSKERADELLERFGLGDGSGAPGRHLLGRHAPPARPRGKPRLGARGDLP